jgi:hypothetical protein
MLTPRVTPIERTRLVRPSTDRKRSAQARAITIERRAVRAAKYGRTA